MGEFIVSTDCFFVFINIYITCNLEIMVLLLFFRCYLHVFLLEHNIPFSAADHFGSLLKSMFPQSKEVMSYTSGRTKTTILVQELASHYTKHD